MFGKNEVASARASNEGFLVHSIWYTIQGEGPWAGFPAIFVRFTGCNLRCFFCDTDFADGTLRSAIELAAILRDMSKLYNCKRFVLTGGEPMLQPLSNLITHLGESYRYQIETAGTIWPKGLEFYNSSLTIVVSPKTPKISPMVAKYASAWKYIIREGGPAAVDGLPLTSTQIDGEAATICRPQNAGQIFVQPCDEQDEARNALNLQEAVRIAMLHNYRLSLQIHKIAGVE